MEGAQVKIPLLALRKALQSKSGKELKELVKVGLEDLATCHQILPEVVAHLLDDVIDKIREESLRFNPRLPFPPAHANNMSIQVEMPTRGKVGVVEYNSQISV